MFQLTIKSIRSNPARFFLTGVAVILGVAFMAGTLVLTDTIKKSYDDVTSNVYKSTDAVVRSTGHIAGDDNGLDTRGTVDASLVAQVRATRGVRAADVQQTGVAVVVAHDGKLLDANRNRAAPIAIGWEDTPALNPMELVSGHAPRAPDDVVIDRMSYDKGHYTLGERVRVVTPTGAHGYHLVGVAKYGGANSAAGDAQVVAFTQATAAQVFGTPGRVNAIQVQGAPGVTQSQLVMNLRATLHAPNVEVVTGKTAAADIRKIAGANMQFIDIFLLTFAIVALVVGSFVIYNTFSITVAQRTKDTALLRAVGASRIQIMRSVRLEALFTGVVASALGVVAGIGAAQGLRSVLTAFGMSLPTAASVVEQRTIVISLVTGIVVTMLAAYLPARRAAKVKPIEAMRDVATENNNGSRRRAIAGVAASGLGAFLIAQGLSGAGIGSVGLGALAVFVGVAMLGPVIARPFTRLIGWPVAHTRGMAGNIARENATRNPRRTSATASALMIGVGLVVLMTVFAASAKTSIKTSIDNAMKSQWIVETQYGMGGLSPNVAHAIDALPQVGSVTPLRFTNPIVNGSSTDLSAFDPATVNDTVDMDVQRGDLSKLGVHDIAVQTDVATKKHLAIGDSVSVYFAETGTQRFRVAALYKTKQPMGSYSMSIAALDANTSTHVDDVVLVTNAPGASMRQVRHAVGATLKDYPTAELRTKQEFKGSVANDINRVLNLVYVLLGMAVLIALFGIANTLALSVFERTREFGLLRAVGMTRAQVRSTVRWESVLIAMLGTALGTAIGLGFGWALVHAAGDQGISQLAVPVQQLAAIVVCAAIAAVVAAALPARRAAKLNVLEAIGD